MHIYVAIVKITIEMSPLLLWEYPVCGGDGKWMDFSVLCTILYSASAIWEALPVFQQSHKVIRVYVE